MSAVRDSEKFPPNEKCPHTSSGIIEKDSQLDNDTCLTIKPILVCNHPRKDLKLAMTNEHLVFGHRP